VTALIAAALAVPLLSLHPLSGAAAGYSFRDTALPGSGGAEPSIAVDAGQTSSQNYIYVTDINGQNLWHSYDGGQTWPPAVHYHAATSGCQPTVFGDEDVLALPNGNVVVGHLNVTNNDVQVSTDHGQTFGTCASVGAESDREWFGNNGNSFVYLAYHDFVGEIPIVCSSINGGALFPLCNQAFTNPHIAQCLENTVMARPVAIDPTDGSINIPYSCSTASQNATQPPYGPLHDYYLAHSFGPLVQGQPAGYTTSNIFIADTSNGKNPNFANIFSSLRIDSAGNYYLVFAGTYDDNHVLSNPYHIYLTTSSNKGATWTTPHVIDSEADGKGTHVFPDMSVTSPGNVDLIWLSAYDPASGDDVTGEPNGVCGSTGQTHPCLDGSQDVGMAPGGPVAANWKLVMAQSTNALSNSPQFSTTQVSPGYMHSGEICTNGIVCGSSDRSLLDYISVAVDCNGDSHIAYADNFGHSLKTHEADQTDGTPLAAPASCGATQPVVPDSPLVPLLPIAALAAVAGAVGLARRWTVRRRLT
jgi:hypothetical protein